MSLLFWRKKEGPLPPAPILVALTPEYKRDHHGIYLSAIEAALDGPDGESVNNLALSGGYGVGKSSILEELARRHKGKVVSISLSTLGFADDPSEAEGVAKTASTKTNRIQKEIVKQLLYGQDPVKMPGSRYRRITRFRFWREVGLAALLAIPLALGFFVSGWSESLANLLRIPGEWSDIANVVVYLASLMFVVGVRKAMHNRIHIASISTGGATIALSAQSATFFDEYIDEIVYFFERTQVDLVIFEDIDRFDDPHIFETLRSLNSLLNAARQLRDRQIRFVYAIKDSIFDQLGQRAAAEELDEEGKANRPRADEAELELARANRTKFFDQVIPVVPFVTHLSARNLLKTELDGLVHKVSDELIDVAGRHIADMRLIKNVRNEFAIFRQRIIVEGTLELSDDNLLAMVLYKSTHLADFERIKHRQSDLDNLYDDYRDLVNRNINRLNAQIRADRIAKLEAKSESAWSDEIGRRLLAYLKRHIDHIDGATFVDQGFANQVLSDADFRTAGTWRRIAAGEEVVLRFTQYVARSGYNMQTKSIFTKAQIAEALNDLINPEAIVTAERDSFDKRIAEANASIAFLRTADIRQLLDRSEFTLTKGGKDNLAQRLQARLGSELARQLVRYGYIDQSFTLYSSTFHAVRVSATATNFMLKAVDRHRIDMTFELTDSDVEAVIREKGRSILQDKSLYNISVLNYLLVHDLPGADVLISRLITEGEDEIALLQAYFADGAHRRRFVARLAPVWRNIFTFLVNESGLDGDLKIKLIDKALRSLAEDVAYASDDSTREFLIDHHTQLSVLTSKSVPKLIPARVGKFFAGAEIVFPSLAALGSEVRTAVVERNAYEVSRANLILALGEIPPKLALDQIRSSDENTHEHVLSNLPSYLDALVADEQAVGAAEQFAQVVAKVLEKDPGSLAGVVARTESSFVVDDLSEISSGAWPVLATAKRFPATFANVTAYVDEYGLDAGLCDLLEAAEGIEVDADDDEREKLALALEILSASDKIPSAASRSGLVKSLQLDDKIDPASVPTEPGELVGRLIGDGIIEDDAESFGLIGADDWPGREYAISRSTEFLNFMSSTELPVAHVGSLMTSEIIGADVKGAVLDRLSEFSTDITRPAFDQTVVYAITSGHGLSLEMLEPIAMWMTPERALKLLKPHLATIPVETLITVLVSLKGEYAKLAGPTGKRPKFKPGPELIALIDRLDELDWVSKRVFEGDQVRVLMKQPAK